MSNLSNNTTELLNILNSLQGKAAGGGGGNGGIIEVLQLPTENIDNRYLYRVTKADCYFNSVKQGTTYVVAELPEVGEPITTDGASVTATYYNDTDNTLYGYLPATIGAALGVLEGWYPATTIISAFGYSYGGVITNLAEATASNTFYLVLTNPLYSYEDGNWYEVATTGASLTLKTRVFHSWDEVLPFCANHNIYRIEAGFLNVEDEELGMGSYASVVSLSFDGCVHLELKPCWGHSLNSVIIVFNLQDGSAYAICKIYKNSENTFVYRLSGNIELYEGSTVTVYYFA